MREEKSTYRPPTGCEEHYADQLQFLKIRREQLCACLIVREK
jgi:hypothetical protein